MRLCVYHALVAEGYGMNTADKLANEHAETVSTEGRVLVDMHVNGRTHRRVTDVARASFLDGYRAAERGRVLDFRTLREANEARLPEFRNALGQVAHVITDGSDWSLNDWAVAAAGELGEACNVLKKVRRGDLTLEEATPLLEQEFADVIIYMDLLSKRADIDLGEAVRKTFNAKSVKVGSRVRIDDGSWHLEKASDGNS